MPPPEAVIGTATGPVQLLLAGSTSPDFNGRLYAAGWVNGRRAYASDGQPFDATIAATAGVFCYWVMTAWYVAKFADSAQVGLWVGDNSATPDLCAWTADDAETGALTVTASMATPDTVTAEPAGATAPPAYVFPTGLEVAAP